MVRIIFRNQRGVEKAIDAAIGSSLMRAAVSHGIDGIVGECGGSAMCATCHVYVDPNRINQLPEMTLEESEMLDCTISERRHTSRLACQITITPELSELVIDLPEAQV